MAVLLPGAAEKIEKFSFYIEYLHVVKHGVRNKNMSFPIYCDSFRFGKIPASAAVGAESPDKLALVVKNLYSEVHGISDIDIFLTCGYMSMEIKFTFRDAPFAERKLGGTGYFENSEVVAEQASVRIGPIRIESARIVELLGGML